VQIRPPAKVAMGKVKRIGNLKEVFRIAAIYPPLPTKKAPPRETNPTKWAKKSNPSASKT
jgi:hypothetical protein